MTENKYPGKDISEDDIKTKFPLVAKKYPNHKSSFDISNVNFGGDLIPIFDGPNMVESEELIIETAKSIKKSNALGGLLISIVTARSLKYHLW